MRPTLAAAAAVLVLVHSVAFAQISLPEMAPKPTEAPGEDATPTPTPMSSVPEPTSMTPLFVPSSSPLLVTEPPTTGRGVFEVATFLAPTDTGNAVNTSPLLTETNAATPSTSDDTNGSPPLESSTVTTVDNGVGGGQPPPALKSGATVASDTTTAVAGTTTTSSASTTTAANGNSGLNGMGGGGMTGGASGGNSLTSGNGSGMSSRKNATAARSPSSSASSGTKDDASSKDKRDGSLGSDYQDSSLSYACVCKDLRKVSLMSASDYCLSPAAVIGNKCGNAAVGEKGECPLAGAQPCQDTGHVLANDSMCAYDKRDDTYKCVASKEDLYIQKNGKRKKPSSARNATSTPPSGGASGASDDAFSGHAVLRLVLLVASLAVGLVAVA